MELAGYIDENGKLSIYRRKELDQWIKANPKRNVVLKMELKRKKRSNQQSRYYWGVVVPIIREAFVALGNDFSEQDTHEALKAKFNCKDIENAGGVTDEIVISTSKLTTVEFMVYLERITIWAAQFLGVTIPAPNEQLTIDAIICHRDEELKTIIVEPIK